MFSYLSTYVLSMFFQKFQFFNVSKERRIIKNQYLKLGRLKKDMKIKDKLKRL